MNNKDKTWKLEDDIESKKVTPKKPLSGSTTSTPQTPNPGPRTGSFGTGNAFATEQERQDAESAQTHATQSATPKTCKEKTDCKAKCVASHDACIAAPLKQAAGAVAAETDAQRKTSCDNAKQACERVCDEIECPVLSGGAGDSAGAGGAAAGKSSGTGGNTPK